MKKTILLVLFAIVFPLLLWLQSNDALTKKIFAAFDSGISCEIVKDPKPTHFEREYVNLKLVKEQKEDLNSKLFLFRPGRPVVDDKGFIYVFDSYQQAVLRFDPELRATGTIGRGGEGPGEFRVNPSGFGYIYVRGDRLYVGDSMPRMIHCFSIPDGKFIRDIKVEDKINRQYVPVVDEGGSIYLHAGAYKFPYVGKNGIPFIRSLRDPAIIDKFDGQGKRLGSLLIEQARKDLCKGLFAEFRGADRGRYVSSDSLNVFFDALGRDWMLVYLFVPSTYYLIERGNVVRQGNLWPNNGLLRLKKRMNQDNWGMIFDHYYCFIDQDDFRHFYLAITLDNGGQLEQCIYQFSLEGKLVKVYRIKYEKGVPIVTFFAKRFQNLYGIAGGKDDMRFVIYKEDKK